MQNRRTFLGSAAAVGVGAAVGGTLVFPVLDSHAQSHTAADPVLTELLNQIRNTVLAVRRGRGRPGEHARRLAADIRLLNAHGVMSAADTRLRQLVAKEGRDGLLARAIDPQLLAAEMRPFGIEQVPTLTATYADRARTLDATLSNGAAAMLATLSAGFDRIAPVLDRYASGRTVVRQDGEECWNWLIFLTGAESVMWEWCALGLEMCYLFVWFYLAWASYMCSLGCLCIV